MDAIKIAKIGNDYQNGVIDYPTASLALVLAGCNAQEAINLLTQVYARPEPEEEN